MNFRTMKMVAAFAVAFFGVAALSSNAQAQTRTVDVNISTDSAITTSIPNPIDYGTFLVIVRAPDSPTLTIGTDAATVAIGGTTTSTVQNLTSSSTFGDMTVDLPVGTSNVILQMSRTAPDGFVGADPLSVFGGTITAVTYGTLTQGDNQAFLVSPATEPVTVVAGGNPEPVRFGSTITFTATPDDDTYTDSFDVSFAY